MSEKTYSSESWFNPYCHIHSSVFTHTLHRAIIYIFIIHFIFEATTSPNAKIYCWFQRSQCLLKIYSLNLLALICLFLHFVITFSLLQKILLLYEKLLTSLLLTLVKQLLVYSHPCVCVYISIFLSHASHWSIFNLGYHLTNI